MSTVLAFTVDFHGPVRVGTGRASAGRDDTVDPGLLPASTVKGVMRAESMDLFGPRLTAAVFGAGRSPSPWHWGDVRFPTPAPVRVGARIRVDDATSAAVRGGLFLHEHLWPDRGTFEVTQTGRVEATSQAHVDVLVASACAVHSIGADRTRGFGWVTVGPADGIADHSLPDRVLALRSEAG